MKIKPLFTAISLATAITTSFASANSYNNFFIAYTGPNDVSAMANYAQQKQLGGFILWEMRGDTAYGSNTSLLSALGNSYANASKPPMVMDYWTDWGVYSNDTQSRAIPEPAYPIPGSLATSGRPSSGKSLDDLNAKLEGINVLAFSFVEAQTKNYSYYDNPSQSMVTIPNQHPEDIGTLYFNDAWADLYAPGNATTAGKLQDEFCGSQYHSSSINSKICWFGLNNRRQAIEPAAGAMMGNFSAFTQLQHSNASNPLGRLRKVISIGGYAHDNTYEDAFDAANGISNFVNSAKAIVEGFKLDGIDLDYENPSMTHQQSQHYLKLIQQLRQALPHSQITVTILSDPNYIKGTRGGASGFAPGVMTEIGKLADHINLMTYDFHGAFDYNPDGSGTTGFLTNLYAPTNAPQGYRFSVDSAVQALQGQGITAEKIVIGIPTYGRSLANINANNGGLFQSLTANTLVPRGDLDLANCQQTITPSSANQCGGMFTYRYIVDKLLSQGLIATEHNDNTAKAANGTTGFAPQLTPPQSSGHTLTIKNVGTSNKGDLAFHVTLAELTDYLNLGASKTFSANQTADLSGEKGLVIEWQGWGTTHGQCPAFDFNANTEVDIEVSPKAGGGGYDTQCSFKQ